MVSVELLQSTLTIHTAHSIVGPWFKRMKLPLGEQVNLNTTKVNYAAKLHPELSRSPEELIISYITNQGPASPGFEIFYEEGPPWIYTPTFLRVNITDAIFLPSET